MDIAIILFDGFDNLDAIGPFEVFHHAGTFGAEVQVGLYTLSPQNIVTSNHGLRIEPDGALKSERSGDASDMSRNVPDLVVVPGGGWGNRSAEGTWEEVQRGDLPNAIATLHAAGATVASVCTGAMLLAHAGITDGRPAVTHHGALDDLRDAGAEILDARVVDDGDLLTAGGVTAGIDLALYLVERKFGQSVATQVATLMEYERHAAVYGR